MDNPNEFLWKMTLMELVLLGYVKVRSVDEDTMIMEMAYPADGIQ